MYDVFISYRRDKGKFIARGLQLALERFGLKVFFDMEELTDGKFNEKIFQSIEQSKNAIFLMTEGALDRCSNEGDWIRKELEHILDRGVNLIPVAPTGTKIVFPAGLPAKLAPMRFIEVSELNLDKLFRPSVRAIADRLKGVTIISEHETKEREEAFLAQARRFKRNDGVIDEEERRQLAATARELGISPARKISLIEKVESEFAGTGTTSRTETKSAPIGPAKAEKPAKAAKSAKRAKSPRAMKTARKTATKTKASPKAAKAPGKPKGVFDEILYTILWISMSVLGGVCSGLLFRNGDWAIGAMTVLLLAVAHIVIHPFHDAGCRSGWAWLGMGIMLTIAACLGLAGHWFWSTLMLVCTPVIVVIALIGA